MTSRPHGKPPNGQRSRSDSAATHQPPTASGQGRSRSSSRWPRASTANSTVSAPASAGPRVPGDVQHPGQQRDEERQRRRSARPGSEPRRLRRHSAMTSRAGPTAASGQNADRREGGGQRQAAGQGDRQGLPGAQAVAQHRPGAALGFAPSRVGQPSVTLASSKHASSAARFPSQVGEHPGEHPVVASVARRHGRPSQHDCRTRPAVSDPQRTCVDRGIATIHSDMVVTICASSCPVFFQVAARSDC